MRNDRPIIAYVKATKEICDFYLNEIKDCNDCPLHGMPCGSEDIRNAVDTIDVLDDWLDEHPEPIFTNRDKFEEIYGFRPTNEDFKGALPCNEEDPEKKLDCITRMGCVCGDCTWWDEEYKEPERENK